MLHLNIIAYNRIILQMRVVCTTDLYRQILSQQIFIGILSTQLRFSDKTHRASA